MKQLILLFLLCSSAMCIAQTRFTPNYRGKPTLIYKTRKDYRNLVPVLLSDDKTTIVSYPAPADIYYQGKLALPTRLKNGYLLDNRGIGLNVAFLKTTYQSYARLSKVPTLAELYNQIIDKDPLTELYNCGNRSGFKNPISEINKAIKMKKLSTFQKIK